MAMTAAMTRPVKALPRSKRRRGGEEDDSTSYHPHHHHHAFVNGASAALDPVGMNGAATSALGSFPMPPYLYYPPTNSSSFPFGDGTTTTAGMGDLNMTMMMTTMDGTATATNNNHHSGIFNINLTATATTNVNDDMTDGHDSHDRERDQQGNTKKRKVPAAAHHHFRSGSGGMVEDGVVGSVPGGVGGDERYGRDDFESEARSLAVGGGGDAATHASSTNANTATGRVIKRGKGE